VSNVYVFPSMTETQALTDAQLRNRFRSEAAKLTAEHLPRHEAARLVEHLRLLLTVAALRRLELL
jgi:hypothetical protein